MAEKALDLFINSFEVSVSNRLFISLSEPLFNPSGERWASLNKGSINLTPQHVRQMLTHIKNSDNQTLRDIFTDVATNG